MPMGLWELIHSHQRPPDTVRPAEATRQAPSSNHSSGAVSTGANHRSTLSNGHAVISPERIARWQGLQGWAGPAAPAGPVGSASRCSGKNRAAMVCYDVRRPINHPYQVGVIRHGFEPERSSFRIRTRHLHPTLRHEQLRRLAPGWPRDSMRLSDTHVMLGTQSLSSARMLRHTWPLVNTFGW